MRLTLSDAAKLLNLSEKEVYRLVREGSLPHRRVGDNYRFHRAEIIEWATERGIATAHEAFPDSRRLADAPLPKFARALAVGGVHSHVGGTDRDSVIRAVIARMPIDEDDRDLLFDVMMARESLGSTGIGEGIAIPHVRAPVVAQVEEPSVTLCFLEHPVDFGAIDGKPVHTVFSLVTLTVRSHLYLLSRLSAALLDSGFRAAIAARASADLILAEATRVDLTIGDRSEDEERDGP